MHEVREFINRSLPPLERACLSKARFDTSREARNMARHGHHQDGSLAPYRCDFCGCWHLGHRRQTNRHRPGYARAA